MVCTPLPNFSPTRLFPKYSRRTEITSLSKLEFDLAQIRLKYFRKLFLKFKVFGIYANGLFISFSTLLTLSHSLLFWSFW